MTICAGRQSCRHKKTWTVMEQSPSPGGQDWFGGDCECWRVKERRTHPRNGEPLRWPSPGGCDHDNMCGKAILPAQENMDGPGTIPLRRAGVTMAVRAGRKSFRHKKTWRVMEQSPAPGGNQGQRTAVPDETTRAKVCVGHGYGIAKTKVCISHGLPERSGCGWLAYGEEKPALAGGRRYEKQVCLYRAGTDKKRQPRKHRMYFPAKGEGN